jgi:hypothetical protein
MVFPLTVAAFLGVLDFAATSADLPSKVLPEGSATHRVAAAKVKIPTITINMDTHWDERIFMNGAPLELEIRSAFLSRNTASDYRPAATM